MIHKKNHIWQPFYHCKTCGLVDEFGCCEACAKICHQGHNVKFSHYANCFCDCGAGDGIIPCKSESAKKMFEILISKGADINEKDNIYLNIIIFFLIKII